MFQASLRKATNVNLSTNLLVSLPVCRSSSFNFMQSKYFISSNILTHLLQATFVTLTQIVKLDLSRNMLVELPENFGKMIKLKHLDLYANKVKKCKFMFTSLYIRLYIYIYILMLVTLKEIYGIIIYLFIYLQISRLPLSLGELKNLRWLDLKENPLTEAVASVAGPCNSTRECQASARNIVAYLSAAKTFIEDEKLRKLNNTGIYIV